MPFGLILLLVVAALIYFGLAHRVLDRMRLTDGQALLILGLMVVGSYITIPLSRGTASVSVNVGGALIPLALAIYLLTKADTRAERIRGIIGPFVTAAVILVIGSFTVFDPPQTNFIDPLWLFSLIGGVVGYVAGRSRRAAFVAGTLGIVLVDVFNGIQAAARGVPVNVSLGGAGVFDAVIIAGLISVGFAELFGETRERLQGGPSMEGDRPQALLQDEGVFDSEDQSRGDEDE